MTKSILEEAQEIIYGDREKTYGSPDKNLKAIANFWQDYLKARYDLSVTLVADDVCIMMALLKLARLANDTAHRDSKVDTAGYIALLDRIQQVTVPAPLHVWLPLNLQAVRNRYFGAAVIPKCIILAKSNSPLEEFKLDFSFESERDLRDTVLTWMRQGYTHFRFE